MQNKYKNRIDNHFTLSDIGNKHIGYMVKQFSISDNIITYLMNCFPMYDKINKYYITLFLMNNNIK